MINNNTNNMNRIEQMHLRGSNNQESGSIEQISHSSTSQSKYIHAVYLVIIALLLCIISNLYADHQNIQQLLMERKVKENDQIMEIKILEKELEKQKQINADKQSLIENNLRPKHLKTAYIHKAAMEDYHQRKIQYIKEISRQSWVVGKYIAQARVSLLLAMNNFKLQHQNIHLQSQINDLLKTEYERLRKQYNFSLPQKCFCVVVPTLNNNQNFRNIYNLRSILNQNYTNYKIVIIDDVSTDQNLEIISQYIEENPVPQKIYLVQNKKREGTVFNIHNAATNYCLPDDILLLVDGDDELLGINVFKVFNSVYTTRNLEVAYSNLIVNTVNTKQVKDGWSSDYSEEEKKRNAYRDGVTRMYPVRTYKVSTFLKIEEKNLKNDQGQWFMSASDEVICPQILQLSCGKNQYINEYFYLYNYGLGNNDLQVDPKLNSRIMHLVRSRKKYSCPLK